MSDLFRLIILAPLAFIAACVASGWILAFALFGGETGGDTVGFFIGTAVVMTMASGAFAFFPSLVAIALAEAFAWRSVFYYLAVGGALALIADRVPGWFGPLEYVDQRLVLFLAAGFAGGLIYWLIAGRLAGVGRAGASPDEGTDPSPNPADREPAEHGPSQ